MGIILFFPTHKPSQIQQKMQRKSVLGKRKSPYVSCVTTLYFVYGGAAAQREEIVKYLLSVGLFVCKIAVMYQASIMGQARCLYCLIYSLYYKVLVL